MYLSSLEIKNVSLRKYININQIRQFTKANFVISQEKQNQIGFNINLSISNLNLYNLNNNYSTNKLNKTETRTYSSITILKKSKYRRKSSSFSKNGFTLLNNNNPYTTINHDNDKNNNKSTNVKENSVLDFSNLKDIIKKIDIKEEKNKKEIQKQDKIQQKKPLSIKQEQIFSNNKNNILQKKVQENDKKTQTPLQSQQHNLSSLPNKDKTKKADDDNASIHLKDSPKLNLKNISKILLSSPPSNNSKEAYVPNPIDTYEKWIGEWKSRQKQRARQEKDKEEKKIRKVALESSFKVVSFAMANSFLMFIAKLYSAIFSRSSSMFSEAIHSLADVFNEALLVWGIARSLKKPDSEHPYGFSAERYIYALISGFGIFIFGGGVSLYHGINGLFHNHILGNPIKSLIVLLFSLISDSTSLHVAYKQIKKSADAVGVNIFKYIKKGNDPTTVQVFLEEVLGVAGCIIAGLSLVLSSWLKCPMLDSVGSIGIGILQSFFSIFLIKKNINSLVQSSLPPKALKEVVNILEKSPIVTSVHDIKSVSIGPDRERFKAEIQLDGRVVTNKYINSIPNNLKTKAKRIQNCKTEEELKEFLIDYGDTLIGTLGGEINKLEMEIQKKRPQIKHVDLEII